MAKKQAILIILFFSFMGNFFSNSTYTKHVLDLQFKSHKMTFQYEFGKKSATGSLNVVIGILVDDYKALSSYKT